MGEAKRLRRLREQVLAASPKCIYCGDIVPATTVDHVPPRAVFDLKRRPRGLEFGACGPCNGGGRLDEQAAALLSRMLPDSVDADKRAEVGRLIRAVSNNTPGFLAELVPSPQAEHAVRQLSAEVGVSLHAVNPNGPIVNRAMLRFAAKIAFALHRHLTGDAVQQGGGACVWWLPNHYIMVHGAPQWLLEMVGGPKTLRQGSWGVGDQFTYASARTVEGTMTAHYATFRESFAICAVVADDVKKITPPLNSNRRFALFEPGWLTSAA